MPDKWTERDLLDALHRRYGHVAYTTARRYGVAEHVSNTGSTMGAPERERVVDFLAQDTYVEYLNPDGKRAVISYELRDGRYVTVGRGEPRQALHGHEIKVSRSDWLRELADPTKADAWKRYCDRWWLVAPPGVGRPEELPDGWGLLVPSRNGTLRTVVHAPLLDPEPMPTRVRAQVMRAVAMTAVRTPAIRDLGVAS